MFTIEGLSVGYGAKAVLRELSLATDTGTVLGVAGYNGAGKTTLLDAIYGLVDAPREAFALDGETLNRTRVAYLTSQNFFYSGITGRDYLELFAHRNPRFDIARWQKVLPLPLDDLTETYSAGMRKKLALLGVLALDKPLVLMDEPFNGLDMESVSVLHLVLRTLARRGGTVILTSHIMESLTSACDAIARLRDGRIERVYAREEFPLLTRSVDDETREKYAPLIDDLFEEKDDF